MDNGMRRLVTHEMEALIAWFLVHMTMEQRVRLMGEMPVTYKILFPGVSDETILAKVTDRFRVTEAQSHLPRITPNV